MGMRCPAVSVVYATLLIHSIPRGSGWRPWIDGLFMETHDTNLAPLSIEGEIEYIWSNCELDFLGMESVQRAVRSLISHDNAGDSNELDSHDLQETVHLSTELKYSLIDCLIKENLFVPVFGGAISAISYAKQMARSPNQYTLLRKILGDQTANKYFHSSTLSAPTVIPRRRTQASEASSAPVDGINTSTLQPSSGSPTPEDDPKDFSPAPLPDGGLALEVSNLIPHHKIPPSEQKSNNTKTIIVAVVVTATVTLTLAALCFYCFYEYLRRKYRFGDGQRDERPLLSLSLNDLSGSSRVSYGMNGALSFMVDINQNVQVASHYTSTEPKEGEKHSIFSSSNVLTSSSSFASTPSPLHPLPLKNPNDKMASSPPPLLNHKSPAPPASGSPLKDGQPPPKDGPQPPKDGSRSPKGGPSPPKGGPPLPKGGPLPPKGPPRPPQANSSSSTMVHSSSHLSANAIDSHGSRTKLKPFFWDKVMTNPDQSMVWHQIKSGSFQFNEEMIETLFGYNGIDNRWSDANKNFANDPSSNYVQILDPKKAQNLAISIKARNVKVEEVCEALMEGNELPVELLQALLRLAPTTDEELKLRLFSGDTTSLGPAEQFLKALVNIPFAFKRMDALLLMAILQEESTYVKDSLATLEEACKELRNSRLFFKLLEAVLKTGNRMNDGTYRGRAQAFKLDTLLKLSDVKGADRKTTLLHFVVREIIQSEGKRAIRVAKENRSNSSITISSFNSDDLVEDVPEESEDQYCAVGLRVVSGLRNELENVKKAAGLDAEALSGALVNLSHSLTKTKEFLNTDMRNLKEESSFHDSLKAFVEHADADITFLLEEEKRMKLLLKSTTNYFYGTAGRDEGLHLFVVVRDFLGMLDNACKEVREAQKKVIRTSIYKDSPTPQSILETRQLIFPEIKDRHGEGFSSDDEES